MLTMRTTVKRNTIVTGLTTLTKSYRLQFVTILLSPEDAPKNISALCSIIYAYQMRSFKLRGGAMMSKTL